MLIEAEAIPYEAAPLRGERLLVLAPHPDDEVIGCGGLIAHHLHEERSVSVLIATDGTKATGAPGDAGSYRELREQEARRGLETLGAGVDLHFLRFPDRGLDDAVVEPLRAHLLSYRPDLICLPSPIEIHPDHLALARAFCLLLQSDAALVAALPLARVAFYEISHPVRPNTLVDITSVAGAKYAAIAAHESQTELKDYVAYARGLNAYRAMTLPREVTVAEGYWLTTVAEVARMPFSGLRAAVGLQREIETTRATAPISVIVRTKDRPKLLAEALQSIRKGGYPAEILVVNDGGAPPSVPEGVKLVSNQQAAGRSEAMNRGVREASSKYIAFLDDDDLYYPEHLPVLAAAAEATPQRAAWYTDALSVFLRPGPSGDYEPHAKMRMYTTAFDRELLLVDNYIPLPTLLVEREAYLAAGGFDRGFDLFEDWDFLIRLAARGDFQHIPRITCEVRHFQGGNSILLSAPEGSPQFREAKLNVWKKHASRMSSETFADVFERQKRRLNLINEDLTQSRGRAAHLDLDVQRFEREKRQLIGELQAVHATVGERTGRIGELEFALQTMQRDANDSAERAAREIERLNKDLRDTQAAFSDTQKALGENQSVLRGAYAEVERLQGLLNMIFRSRTWKLHTIVEKIRGRG